MNSYKPIDRGIHFKLFCLYERVKFISTIISHSMVKKRYLKPLPILDEQSLLNFLAENKIKATHAKAVWKYICNTRMDDLDMPVADFLRNIPNIPAALPSLLQEKFVITTSRVVQKQVSGDGTIKLLIELQDRSNVECVIIHHTGVSAERYTLCVSSQVTHLF